MNVTVNGERHAVGGTELTVTALLDELDVEQRKGIAIARNMRVVPRTRWNEELVREGDEIEIVRATQGG